MRGISPRDPEALMRITGYATQYDTAPRWATGFTFITTGLLLFGYGRAEAEEKAWKALERVSLTEAANRKVAAYSKGMRQRVRLAQAIAHDPELLVLDEPLNGLDPLVRAETIALFRTWANEGKHVILSSHVLQEVDLISDQVVLIANGMIIAEGNDPRRCARRSTSTRASSSSAAATRPAWRRGSSARITSPRSS